MFILYSVDTSFERKPIANWLIFALLILVFVIGEAAWHSAKESARQSHHQKLGRAAEEISGWKKNTGMRAAV